MSLKSQVLKFCRRSKLNSSWFWSNKEYYFKDVLFHLYIIQKVPFFLWSVRTSGLFSFQKLHENYEHLQTVGSATSWAEDQPSLRPLTVRRLDHVKTEKTLISIHSYIEWDSKLRPSEYRLFFFCIRMLRTILKIEMGNNCQLPVTATILN
jgi:hypothetical protein